jgi:hypothetical protein
MPKVWNKRDKNCPKDAVYVGRPSKWGNPWKIGEKSPRGVEHRIDRAEAIRLYCDWLNGSLDMSWLRTPPDPLELRGKDLVCWCAPLPCHADVLLELANN